ncbi:hypothetical protein RGQ29_025543 [Quercus rubra]|uniref:Uncharacterized protein n=1 Tax=Quercus rubra TaxID=3512 RepID=A0AAN7EZ54_QUERU|nr:hypothetical protein RGQ29_025543 [Quercus rubra]
MASGQERSELDSRAGQGETVVPGGTGGKSLEAQEHLAEGAGAVEGRQGGSSWDMRSTRSWAAKEDRLGMIRWDMRDTRRRAAKADSAPWTSLEEIVLPRKASRLKSPSSGLRAVDHY